MIFLQAILVGVIGGTTGALIKVAVGELPPLLVIVIRFFICILLLLPIIFKKIKLPKKDLFPVLAGGILFAINIVFFTIGIQYTSIIMSQLIYVPSALIVAVMGYIFLKEKIHKNQMIGLTLTLIGLAILFQGSFAKNDSVSFGTPLGNILIITGLFCWAGYILFSRRASKNYSPLEIAYFNIVITFVFSLVLIPLDKLLFANHPVNFSIKSILALAAVGVTTCLFMVLHQRLIQKTSAFISSFITYINPIWASILGTFFFGEKLRPALILGSVIIFLGVFIATSYDYIKKNLIQSS